MLSLSVGKFLLLSLKEIRFDNLESTTFFEARTNLVKYLSFCEIYLHTKSQGCTKRKWGKGYQVIFTSVQKALKGYENQHVSVHKCLHEKGSCYKF